jgi:hypothetical protein
MIRLEDGLDERLILLHKLRANYVPATRNQVKTRRAPADRAISKFRKLISHDLYYRPVRPSLEVLTH